MKPNKLSIKKITLRDLDQTALEAVAGGNSSPCPTHQTCPTALTCRTLLQVPIADFLAEVARAGMQRVSVGKANSRDPDPAEPVP